MASALLLELSVVSNISKVISLSVADISSSESISDGSLKFSSTVMLELFNVFASSTFVLCISWEESLIYIFNTIVFKYINVD